VGAYCGVVVPRPGKRGERRGRGGDWGRQRSLGKILPAQRDWGGGRELGKIAVSGRYYPSDIEDNRVKRVPLLQTEPEFTLSGHLRRKESRSPFPLLTRSGLGREVIDDTE